MSSDKKIHPMTVDSQESTSKLQEQHERVQQQLRDDPELAAKFRPLQDQVDQEIDDVNRSFFSEEAYIRENKLRETLRDIFSDSTFNITDAESLITFVNEYKKAYSIERGKAGYFLYKFSDKKEKMMTITIMGTLELVPKYVNRLERQLMVNIRRETETEGKLKAMYNLSFWGYIKLAFKKLFGGKING